MVNFFAHWIVVRLIEKAYFVVGRLAVLNERGSGTAFGWFEVLTLSVSDGPELEGHITEKLYLLHASLSIQSPNPTRPSAVDMISIEQVSRQQLKLSSPLVRCSFKMRASIRLYRKRRNEDYTLN